MDWVALAGAWKFHDSEATFLRPQDPTSPFPFGMALASGRFRAGSVSVTVTLEDPGQGIPVRQEMEWPPNERDISRT